MMPAGRDGRDRGQSATAVFEIAVTSRGQRMLVTLTASNERTARADLVRTMGNIHIDHIQAVTRTQRHHAWNHPA